MRLNRTTLAFREAFVSFRHYTWYGTARRAATASILLAKASPVSDRMAPTTERTSMIPAHGVNQAIVHLFASEGDP